VLAPGTFVVGTAELVVAAALPATWATGRLTPRPDVDALAAARTRIVIAVGEESLDTFTGRTAVATGEVLGQQATVFPSHPGGFLGSEFGYAGQPEAFARKLREVLDDD
jgi:hypothetical protein